MKKSYFPNEEKIILNRISKKWQITSFISYFLDIYINSINIIHDAIYKFSFLQSDAIDRVKEGLTRCLIKKLMDDKDECAAESRDISSDYEKEEKKIEENNSEDWHLPFQVKIVSIFISLIDFWNHFLMLFSKLWKLLKNKTISTANPIQHRELGLFEFIHPRCFTLVQQWTYSLG